MAKQKHYFLVAFQPIRYRLARHQALTNQMEVHLRAARMVLLVSLLTVPALTQQSGMMTPQLPGRNWTLAPSVRPEPPREADLRLLRLQAIHEDAQHLSALSISLQSDLQQLQKGMLTKDLADNLKKIERLSKKLRQEVAQ